MNVARKFPFNSCMMFRFFTLCFYGAIWGLLFSSLVVQTAEADASLKRPSFTLSRRPGTQFVDLLFKSTNSLSYSVETLMKIIWQKSLDGGISLKWGGDLSNYGNGTTSYLDCNADVQKCQDVIDVLRSKSFSLYLPEEYNENGCIQILSVSRNNSGSVAWKPSNGHVCSYVPPTDCVGDDCDIDEGGTPEPALACSVKTSSINLAFGNMAMGEALNKTVSSKINVNCNKAGAKLSMSLKSGGSSISLSNGMTAELTAGGQNLGTLISAAKGDNNITILGALAGTEKEGTFSGSSVLVTDYQ